jgi:hypothetical protein
VDRRVRAIERLGPNRRRLYMAHGVRHYLNSFQRAQQRSDPGRLLRIFIMAHTHLPFFSYVNVGHPARPRRDEHTVSR